MGHASRFNNGVTYLKSYRLNPYAGTAHFVQITLEMVGGCRIGRKIELWIRWQIQSKLQGACSHRELARAGIGHEDCQLISLAFHFALALFPTLPGFHAKAAEDGHHLFIGKRLHLSR